MAQLHETKLKMFDSKAPRTNEEEIDLLEILSVLWKGKWLIVLTMVICIGSAWLYADSGKRIETKALLRLEFEGINKHHYPDGSQFEMYDVIAPDILSKASSSIENKATRDIFLKNPRNFVFIDPFIPAEVQKKIEEMAKAKNTFNYLPVQFTLSFAEEGKTLFSERDRKALMQSIIETYRKKFEDRFISSPLVSIDFLNKKQMSREYIDLIEIIRNVVLSYSDLADKKLKEAGHFSSNESGDSYAEIALELTNLRDIDLNEIDSICRTAGITKKKAEILSRYQSRVRELERERMKKEQEDKLARELLAEVWRNEKGALTKLKASSLMLTEPSIFDKFSERDYISFLLKRSLDAGVKASSLAIDKQFLEAEIEELRDNKQSANEKFTPAFVENRIDEIRNKVINLGIRLNSLNKEYMEKRYSNTIKVIAQPETIILRSHNLNKMLAISMIAGSVLSIFLVLLADNFSQAIKQRKSSVMHDAQSVTFVKQEASRQ